jgi:hypothetical protein
MRPIATMCEMKYAERALDQLGRIRSTTATDLVLTVGPQASPVNSVEEMMMMMRMGALLLRRVTEITAAALPTFDHVNRKTTPSLEHVQ